MALGTFVAGAYTGTYVLSATPTALGITEDGYELQWEPKQEVIERSDVYGDLIIDTVYRGTNWFLQTEFMEYVAVVGAAAYPWGASFGTQGVIGRLASGVAAQLVLTSTANTTAAAAPATLTAPGCILAPGFTPRAVFSSRLRTVPARFVLLPYSSSGIRSLSLT